MTKCRSRNEIRDITLSWSGLTARAPLPIMGPTAAAIRALDNCQIFKDFPLCLAPSAFPS
jgi:hypothetical protein